MAQFQIGDFDFINLSRPPSAAQRRLLREVRPGGQGVTFWRMGQFTEPFQLTSVRDCANIVEAQQALFNYQAIAGGDPVPLLWAGVQYLNVIVLGVEPIDGGVYATLIGIGGQLGTSRAMLRCVWMLELVPVQEEQ